jgi:cephalosporin-C deacetylase
MQGHGLDPSGARHAGRRPEPRRVYHRDFVRRGPRDTAARTRRAEGVHAPTVATEEARVSDLQHGYEFDPTYGYDLDALLAVEAPPEPPGYAEFWSARHAKALAVDPAPRLSPSDVTRAGMRISEVRYRSTDDFAIRGWLLEPEDGRSIRGGFLVGHGYGGIERPDFELLCDDAVYFVPSPRGLGPSARPPISTDPCWHVLHDIQDRDRYILGGCVEDLWTGVSALLVLRPDLQDRLGFFGHSFGGGIGAMALAWDPRLSIAHLDVPTFGHQPLRLRLPTTGSAAAVQRHEQQHGRVLDTLAYFDAAVAAGRIEQPVHLAAALFDPVVVPPGQFAIYKALAGKKELFVRTAGHFTHDGSATEDRKLMAALRGFFGCDEPPLRAGTALTGA